MSRQRTACARTIHAALLLLSSVLQAQQTPAPSAGHPPPPPASPPLSGTSPTPVLTLNATATAASTSAASAKSVTHKPAHELIVKGVVLPRVIHKVNAVFPADIQDDDRDVRVRVAMIVNEKGEPTDLKIVKPAEDASFNTEALHAVTQYRFKPAQRKHKAIAYPFQVTIEFRSEWVEDPPKRDQQ